MKASNLDCVLFAISVLLVNLLSEVLGDGLLVGVGGAVLDLALLLVVDLLNDGLLVAHLRHHRVGALQGLHQRVDSLVQLVQVLLHVLLLTFEVFWLLIILEVLKILLVAVGLVVLLLIRDVASILRRLLCLLLGVLVGSRVRVLLVHESLSSLKGPPLDIVSGLREQVTEREEDLLTDAHEDDIGHWLISFVPIFKIIFNYAGN